MQVTDRLHFSHTADGFFFLTTRHIPQDDLVTGCVESNRLRRDCQNIRKSPSYENFRDDSAELEIVHDQKEHTAIELTEKTERLGHIECSSSLGLNANTCGVKTDMSSSLNVLPCSGHLKRADLPSENNGASRSCCAPPAVERKDICKETAVEQSVHITRSNNARSDFSRLKNGEIMPSCTGISSFTGELSNSVYMKGLDLASMENTTHDAQKEWTRCIPTETRIDLPSSHETCSSLSSGESSALLGELSTTTFVNDSTRPHTADLDFAKDVITLGERINNVNLCMEWIREELLAMRAQDWSLKRQFYELNRQIQELKVVVEVAEALHEEESELGEEEGEEELEEEAEENKKQTVQKKSNLRREDSGYNSEVDNMSPRATPQCFFEMTI